MAQDRAFEVRVVARPTGRPALAEVRRTVAAALGEGWRVGRLVPGSVEVLVTGRADAPVGTATHARVSHDAALTLARAGGFEQVEADVPVPGFAPPPPVAPASPRTGDDVPDDVPDAAVAPATDGAADTAGDTVADVVADAAADDQPCGAESEPLDWARRLLRWDEALDLMAPEARGGVGIRIGHPDSGYTLHPNLGAAALDLATDRDVIDGDDDALDDLDPNPLWPLPNPGHGTSTASVIAGRGDDVSGIVGIGKSATLVPIRATESVVQLFDSDVAKAVDHARKVGCHVISMSLGGKGFFGLETQIQRAVDAGMIVMAAAGNKVGVVTAPASYGNCLAVAATGPGDVRWSGSSRGRAVDVSMPGHCVWVANYDGRTPKVGRSDGTSYAVAHLAGAAALWLAHHGHDAIVARVGQARVQAAFLAVLHWPGVCVVPPDWDTEWGIGRVDLVNLLQAPLPSDAAPQLDAVRASGVPVAAPRRPEGGAVERLAATVSADPVLVRRRLATLLGAASPDELASLLRDHEGELVWLALADPTFAASLAAPADGRGPVAALDAGPMGELDRAAAPAPDALRSTPALAGVSGELAHRLGA